MDLIDIYRTFHPKTTEYSLFSSAYGTFSRIDHIVGHKSGPNQYLKIEIIFYIFSDHSALKLELNHKKKSGRNSYTWKLKTILPKNVWVNQRTTIHGNQWKTNENENTSVQSLWDMAKAVRRGKYITICFLKALQHTWLWRNIPRPQLFIEERMKCRPRKHVRNFKLHGQKNKCLFLNADYNITHFCSMKSNLYKDQWPYCLILTNEHSLTMTQKL